MIDQYKKIQVSVDNLLNVKSIIKRKKKSVIEKKKEMFAAMISLYEENMIRAHMAYHEIGIDLYNYESSFIDIIEILMTISFGKISLDLISFYVYDRMDEEGNIIKYKLSTGEEVALMNPYDLWDLMVKLNPKIEDGTT